MFESLLAFFAGHLITTMWIILGLALTFRFFSYRSSKVDQVYFNSFTREVEKCLDEDKGKKIENIDNHLKELIDRVGDKLPKRSIRFSGKSHSTTNAKKVVSLRDYVGGQKSLIHNIHTESTSFKSKYPPNFVDLTTRILSQDERWVKLFGIIPIDGISRMIDILPGIFIVFGVFGTFIGISQALPEIARMDFNNLDASGVILSQFVTKVTFAMRSSVAGILCSLILTFLNTMVPIKGVRNRIFKKVANCFEGIWFSIHGGRSIEEKMIKIYPEMLSSLQSIDENIKIMTSGNRSHLNKSA